MKSADPALVRCGECNCPCRWWACRCCGGVCCLLCGVSIVVALCVVYFWRCPHCMKVNGQKDFIVNWIDSGCGCGSLAWYAPAGTDPALFAAQLIARKVDESVGRCQEYGGNFSFRPRWRAEDQLFGLEYMGTFGCRGARWEEMPPTMYGDGWPDHHFQSGVEVWIWDDREEYLYKGFTPPFSLVIQNPIYIAIGLVPMAFGAFLLVMNLPCW